MDCTEFVAACPVFLLPFSPSAESSVSWDIKALDGPEATLKGKILQSLTQGGMKTGGARKNKTKT